MATKRLDVRGEICPDPLTHTLGAMRNLALGDRLEVIVDSPLALETISRWVRNNYHRLVEVTEVGLGQWQITIEKSA